MSERGGQDAVLFEQVAQDAGDHEPEEQWVWVDDAMPPHYEPVLIVPWGAEPAWFDEADKRDPVEDRPCAG